MLDKQIYKYNSFLFSDGSCYNDSIIFPCLCVGCQQSKIFLKILPTWRHKYILRHNFVKKQTDDDLCQSNRALIQPDFWPKSLHFFLKVPLIEDSAYPAYTLHRIAYDE